MAVLLIVFFGNAQETFGPDGYYQVPNQPLTLQQILDKTLEKQKSASPSLCASSALKDALGLDTYDDFGYAPGNSGLVRHFTQTLANDKCFSERAYRFWQSMRKSLSKEPAHRPSLNEKAGAGIYSKYKPGWLWEKALEAVDGDPVRAMALVTMCTHDDVTTGPRVSVTPELASEIEHDQLAATRKKIKEYEEKLRTAPSVASPHAAQLKATLVRLRRNETHYKDAIKNKTYNSTEPIFCAKGESPAFAPGALGAEVNLPEELRREIAKVQAPTKGASVLPAKAYHFSGSAYLGCRLAQCGLSVESAAEITGFLGKAYRLNRLHHNFEEAEKQMQSASERADLNYDDPRFPEKSDLDTNKLALLDAVRLYKKIGPMNEAVSRDRDPLRDPPATPMQKVPDGTLCKIPGWSVERCDRARKKLHTWQVDIKWTEAQHAIGGKFGATKCANVKPKESLCAPTESPPPTMTEQ